MKIKVIDLLNAKYENGIKEGFRFVLRNNVYQTRKNTKEDLIFAIPETNREISDNHYLENILDEEIEVLTPELIENSNSIIRTISNASSYFHSQDAVDSLRYHFNSKKIKIIEKDIDNLIKESTIETEQYADKTTIVKITLPNRFVIVESSSCVDPSNFDMEVGKEICMKKIKDKIWELEGYKLQSELNEG